MVRAYASAASEGSLKSVGTRMRVIMFASALSMSRLRTTRAREMCASFEPPDKDRGRRRRICRGDREEFPPSGLDGDRVGGAFLDGNSLPAVGANGQDRTRGPVQHVLRDTAEPRVCDAAATVGTHDNQVAVVLIGGLYDRPCRIAHDDF